jgi:hypothetical protein
MLADTVEDLYLIAAVFQIPDARSGSNLRLAGTWG